MRTKLFFLFTLLTLFITCPSFSKDSVHFDNVYSEENPLVYEDAYNLWPYSFLNDKGEPDGFNIDMLKMIMDKLDIPYIIRLKHPSEVLEDIKNGKANLTAEIYSEYNSQFGQFGNSVISLFTHSIASPISHPTTIKKFSDLSNTRITVKENSICHSDMIDAGIADNAIPQEDMIEAIMNISHADSGMVLWNTMSLKYLINKYHLNNLQITPILMSNDEYRFLSNDTTLLGHIDKIHKQLAVNEEMQPIRNKWFYPEAKASGIPEYIWYIAAALVAVMLVLMLNIVIYRKKLKTINKKAERQTQRLALYMRSGHAQAITYDIESNTFQSYSLEGNKLKDFTPEEFSVYFNLNDFEKTIEAINRIKSGKSETENLHVRGHKPETPDINNYFRLNLSTLHSNNGVPTVLLATLINITDERNTVLKANDLLQRYHSVFNTTMSDMFYFDGEGRLTEINDRACETLGITDKTGLLNDNIRLEDITVQPVTIEREDGTQWVNMLYDLDAIPDSNNMKKYISRKGVLYYEARTASLYDDNGNKLCTLVTGIDVSDTTYAIKERKKQTELIISTTRRVSEYVFCISNALNVSQIRIVNYYPDTRTLTLKHNLNDKRMELSQLRCMEFIDSSEHQDISTLIKAMDKRKLSMVTKKVKTIFKDKAGRDVYLSINFVPIYKDNVIDHYFGLCRDISELTETEMRLKQEMEKAQETELLKNTFLRNMSHDIRTPLNSIVGFAELFNYEHSMDDENVFIGEIKKNTHILLGLINDILFLSRLEANMLDFKTAPTDVSTLFKAHCSIGWSKELSNEVEAIIECPNDNLLLNIDSTHFSHIVDILSANSALFCKVGTIRARCEYIIDNLHVTFQDTGVGIDEESMKHLFDRSVDTDNIEQGRTKIGLVICKSLIEQLGGELSISSELDMGTTIRFNIPCTKVDIEEMAEPALFKD